MSLVEQINNTSEIHLNSTYLTYQNFDLHIELVDSEIGCYRAKVTSPAGEASNEFIFPFSDSEIENLIQYVSQLHYNIRMPVSSEPEDVVRVFGCKLFSSIFTGQVKERLVLSLNGANKRDQGIRIRLHFDHLSTLANLPWEFLCDPSTNSYLACSRQSPLVRYLDIQQPISQLHVKLPLNILVMIANPRDLNLPLNVKDEWNKIRNALGGLEKQGIVRLTQLHKATISQLQSQLRKHKYHVFHFVGHGSFDQKTQSSCLLFEDEQGNSHWVNKEQLWTLMSDQGDLRLVLLNTCEGAFSSRKDPFAGIAQHLVQRGIPAVIAMQFEITDCAAIKLADEFYQSLAANFPVDAALTEARKALLTNNYYSEWGAPVLYMRSLDGKLFEIDKKNSVPLIARVIAAIFIFIVVTVIMRSGPSATYNIINNILQLTIQNLTFINESTENPLHTLSTLVTETKPLARIDTPTTTPFFPSRTVDTVTPSQPSIGINPLQSVTTAKVFLPMIHNNPTAAIAMHSPALLDTVNAVSIKLPTAKSITSPTIMPSPTHTSVPTQSSINLTTPTETVSVVPTATPMPTVTPEVIPANVSTGTPISIPSFTPTLIPTLSATPTPVATVTPTIPPTATPTPVATVTPTIPPTATPTPVATATPTIPPTATPTPVPTDTPLPPTGNSNSENLLKGGSFENKDDLKLWVTDPNDQRQIIESPGYVGQNLLKTAQSYSSDLTANWVAVSQLFTIRPGAPYLFSAMMKWENAVEVHVKIHWYKGCKETFAEQFAMDMPTNSDGWRLVALPFQAPLEADTAKIEILHGVLNGQQNILGSTLWIDDIAVTSETVHTRNPLDRVRYVRLIADSEVTEKPWTSVAELKLIDRIGNLVEQSSWRLSCQDSSHPGEEAEKAFDGNISTIWHTQYVGGEPLHPHEVQIDLGNIYSLSGFVYVPRQDLGNGRISRYRFYVSEDGLYWGQPVAEGIFQNTTSEQRVDFSINN